MLPPETAVSSSLEGVIGCVLLLKSDALLAVLFSGPITRKKFLDFKVLIGDQ
jgi:hypothetical protein